VVLGGKERESEREGTTHVMARRTSPMGMTPSFSPSMGSEKRPKASLMSASSWAVMLCSFASLDWRGCFAPEAPEAAAVGGRRFGGWEKVRLQVSLLSRMSLLRGV